MNRLRSRMARMMALTLTAVMVVTGVPVYAAESVDIAAISKDAADDITAADEDAVDGILAEDTSAEDEGLLDGVASGGELVEDALEEELTGGGA